jgi:hypothetical protein
MSENINIILMILISIGVFFLTRRFAGWKMNKAAEFIISDLKERNALNAASAVELPYCQRRILRIGLRDYRPTAMEQLVKFDIVRKLEGDRYFLLRTQPPEEEGGAAFPTEPQP